MFFIVKFFSLNSSNSTPPNSSNPVSGVMLISGLTPFPLRRQLTILLLVKRIKRCSKFWFSVGWNSTTTLNFCPFYTSLFRLFKTEKQQKAGSCFFFNSIVYPWFVIINYLIYRAPTAISPKSMTAWSAINTLSVDVVVTYRKLTSDDPSG